MLGNGSGAISYQAQGRRYPAYQVARHGGRQGARVGARMARTCGYVIFINTQVRNLILRMEFCMVTDFPYNNYLLKM